MLIPPRQGAQRRREAEHVPAPSAGRRSSPSPPKRTEHRRVPGAAVISPRDDSRTPVPRRDEPDGGNRRVYRARPRGTAARRHLPSHRLLRVTDTLLLLDGHSLAYRAWFALPVENFATTTGLPTNAVYGFTAMLINVLRDEQPTRVAVAFDRSEPTFRHEKYVEYKAGRTKAPDEFRSQISLIFEVLDALGIRHLSAPGYEADDIIATLAAQAEQQGEDVLIVTGDRDTFQLVSDKTTVLYN